MIRFIAASLILVLMVSSVAAQTETLSSQFGGFADARLQRSPNTLRGGINFSPSEPSGSLTIYRGRMQLDSMCGFDFNFNFTQQLARFLAAFEGQLRPLIVGIVYVVL